MRSIVLALLLTLALADTTCISKTKEQYVYATQNEFYQWDMREIFFEGSDLTYSLSEQDHSLSVEEPIALLNSKPIVGGDLGKVVGLTVFRDYENTNYAFWKNAFAFIEENDKQTNLYYSYGFVSDTHLAPDFKSVAKVYGKITGYSALGLDYTVTEDDFIVDTQQVTPGQLEAPDIISNGFVKVLVTEQVPQRQLVSTNAPAAHPYRQVTSRKIQVHYYLFSQFGPPVGQLLVFRGAPAYAYVGFDIGKKTSYDSYIEIFKVSMDGIPEADPVVVIDSAALTAVMGYTKTLTLMGFKVMPNGDIYVLDVYDGLYVLRIDQNFKLSKKSTFQQAIFARHYDFDYNVRLLADGTTEENLVILHDANIRFYKNGQLQNGYKLSVSATWGDQISLTSKYIIIRQTATGKSQLFSTYHNLLVSSGGLKNPEQILVNPYEPDIIGVSRTTGYRYKVSHGYLVLNKPALLQDDIIKVTLTAAVGNPPSTTDKCQVTLNYKILKPTDYGVYNSQADPLPPVFAYPSDPIAINQIAIGPNIIYTPLGGEGAIKYSVKEIWDLNMQLSDGTTFPAATDVIYGNIIADEGSDVYYLFLQLTNKVCVLYKCTHDRITTADTTCSSWGSFLAPVEIDLTAQFQWYLQFGQIHFVFLDADRSQIKIYTASGSDPKVFKTLKFDDGVKVLSYNLFSSHLYVVTSQVKQGKTVNQVEIREILGDFKVVFTVSKGHIADQGVKGEYVPTKVFGNKLVKSQLIFIQSGSILILGVYDSDFSVIETFPIDPTAELQVAIGPKSFWVVSKFQDSSKDSILEYDFRNLNQIILMKSVSTYGYKLQTPLTADYCALSGYLFVRATKNAITSVLLYEPMALSHKTLLKVIDLSELIVDGKTLMMSIDGKAQMFAYLNDGKKQKVLSILPQTMLMMSPGQDSPAYVNKAIVSLNLRNTLSTSMITYRASVTLLNTQSAIEFKVDYFKKKNQAFPITNSAAEQFVDMGTDWYQGQVQSFNGLCAQCGANNLVQVINPVHSVTDGSQLEQLDISAGAQFNADTMVYQANAVLAFQEISTGKAIKLIDINKELQGGNLNCVTVTVSEDSKYIFSACFYIDDQLNKVNYIIMHICTNLNCTIIPSSAAVDAKNVAKMHYLDGCLIVMDTHLSYYNDYQGKIATYQVKIAADQKSFQLMNELIVSGATLKIDKPIYMMDFDIIKFTYNKQVYYKLIISSADTGIITVDASITEGRLQKVGFESFDLRTYLNENGQYIKEDPSDRTIFLQVRVIYQSIDGSRLSVTSLVTTNNVAQYSIHNEFVYSQGSFPIDKATRRVPVILNQYGNWRAINTLTFVKGYVAIPYTNADRDQVLIAVYELPAELPKAGLQATTTLLPFIGAIQNKYQYPQTQDFALNLVINDKKPYLFANIVPSTKTEEDMLIKYSVYNQPQIYVRDGSQLQNQDLTIVAYNAFGEDKIVVPISNTYKKPAGSSSSNWWWITLLVVFGVLLVGGGGFFLYTKYFKRSGVDPLLG